MVQCARCGKENPAGNRFCVQCGAPLEGAEPVASTARVDPTSPTVSAPQTSPTFPTSPAAPWILSQVAGEALQAVRADWTPEPRLVACSLYVGISALFWLIEWLLMLMFLIGVAGVQEIVSGLGGTGLPREPRWFAFLGFLGVLVSSIAFFIASTATVGLWRQRRWAVGWTVAAQVFNIFGSLVAIILIAIAFGVYLVLYTLLYGIVVPVAIIVYVLRPEVQARLM